MARRSVLDRYAELEGRRADMDQARTTAASVTPIHIATIDVLTTLLTLGNTLAGEKVPAPLRAMMRTLDMMKPVLIEELAAIPPEQIVSFMAGLRDQIDRIVVAGEGEGVLPGESVLPPSAEVPRETQEAS